MNDAVLDVQLDDDDGPFGPVIYSYTRQQALADGQQVQAPEALAKEAGFKWPVFITSTVWEEAVTVPPGVAGQDLTGRLWDLLWLARLACQADGPEHGPRKFAVWVRNSDDRGPRPCEYWADCGPTDFDNPAPAITIMADQDL
jgi:hypothetical protein